MNYVKSKKAPTMPTGSVLIILRESGYIYFPTDWIKFVELEFVRSSARDSDQLWWVEILNSK